MLVKSFRILVCVVLLAHLSTGCSWMNLSADYDPVLDTQTTQLYQDTETFFTEVETSIGTQKFFHSEHQDFYSNAKGRTKALFTRAELHEEGLASTPLTDNFENLLMQYENLEAEHKRQSEKMISVINESGMDAVNTKPYALYWDSALKGFQQSFRAIMAHLMVLKGIREEQIMK